MILRDLRSSQHKIRLAARRKSIAGKAAIGLFVPLFLFLSACTISPLTANRPAPVTHLGTRLDSAAGAVMVRRGENLYQVSKRYKVNLNDLAAVNDLTPPYKILEGQRLLLPLPEAYKVKPTDTLQQVSRMYQVSIADLIRLNDLEEKRRLRVGETLRLPGEHAAPSPSRQVSKQFSKKHFETVETEDLAPVRVASAVSPRTMRVMNDASVPLQAVQPASRAGYVWPVRGQIVSSYGAKEGGLFNDGVNISAPKGAPVRAAAAGRVIYVGDSLSSYGNLVLIRHSGDIVTAYAHLNTVDIRRDMQVDRGDIIGTVGSTGSVANPQLHFEVRQGVKTLDPRKFL